MAVTFDRVSQWVIEVYLVLVSPALARLCDVPTLTQLRHDTLDRPLSNTHAFGDIPRAGRRVFSQANQHVGVVREEGPFRTA
jgi:hypothetical protein